MLGPVYGFSNLKSLSARSMAAAGVPDPVCKTGVVSLKVAGKPQSCCAGYCGVCNDYATCKNVRGQDSKNACCASDVYTMRCGGGVGQANNCVKKCSEGHPPCIMDRDAVKSLTKPTQNAADDCNKAVKDWRAAAAAAIEAGKAAKPAAAETASACKCADPLFDIKNPSDWLGKYWPGKPPSPMQNLSQALLFMDQCTADDFIAGQAAMSKAPGDAFANNRVMARFGNYVRECGGKTGRSQWCGWPGATKDLYNPGNHFGGWQEITEWWSAANGGGWQPTVVVGGRTRTAWSKAQKTSAYDNLKAALKKAYKAHKGEDYPEECQKAAR